jgi:hypothetical protein
MYILLFCKSVLFHSRCSVITWPSLELPPLPLPVLFSLPGIDATAELRFIHQVLSIIINYAPNLCENFANGFCSEDCRAIADVSMSAIFYKLQFFLEFMI